MKTLHILETIAIALILTGTPACSDNKEPNLIPSATPTTLSAMMNDEPLNKLVLNAGPDDKTIYVNSNTRWAVECTEGGWCSLSAVNGSGDGSFKFSVLENMTAPRYCDIVLYKLNAQGEKIEHGKWTIAVQQASSDVSLSPSSVEPFSQTPTNIQDFTIKANAAWRLSVEYELPESPKYINIIPKDGMTAGEDGTFRGSANASFSIRLDNNGTAAVRTAKLNLVSDAGTYSVTIIQQASTYTFDVSPNSTRYISAEGGTEDFTIMSRSEWDITTNDPEWIEISPTSGTGGDNKREPVTVRFKANNSGDQRTSSIHFIPRKEGSVPVIVNVMQSGYDLTYAGSVQSGSTLFAATGGILTYSLDSRFNWEVAAPTWITATPSKGDRSMQRQTITLQAAPNTTNSTHDDTVTITPVSTVFPGDVTLDPSELGIKPITLSVSQYSFSLVFGMSPGGFDVIPLEGGSYELTVNSRFDWRLTVPEWATASRTEGSGSTADQKITVNVGRNPNNGSRNGILTLTPLATDFDGVKIDPSSFKIDPQSITITQFGGREAAVSVPWLVDGYTHTTATVEFNFYSPFYDIVEAGLEWGINGSNDWQTMTVTPGDSKDCTVSFELTNLNAATKYVTRGYVKDSQGNVKYGNWSYPFTTAGRYPGSGDNPTPTK